MQQLLTVLKHDGPNHLVCPQGSPTPCRKRSCGSAVDQTAILSTLPSPSALKHLPKGERGAAEMTSLADGYRWVGLAGLVVDGCRLAKAGGG